MRARGIRVFMTLVLVLGMPLSTMAFVIQNGQTVTISDSLRDDLYAAGAVVMVTSNVDGDVAAAGRTVTVKGSITGGVLAAGREVSIGGTVARAVRAVGQSVNIASTVGSDAVVLGADITVADQTQIGRDLLASGKDIHMAGDIGRYARLTGDTVVVTGKVGRGLRVDARSLTIMPSAKIGGDVRYSADTAADVRPGAQITGKIERVARPTSPSRVFGLPVASALRLWEAFGLLVIGLVVVSLAPQRARTVASQALVRFPISLAAGLAVLVLVSVISALLVVIIIGIPLAAIALVLLVCALYLTQAFVTTGIGSVLLTLIRRDLGASMHSAVALGTVLLAVLFATPYGWVFRLLSMTAGLGALAVTVWKMRPRGPEPAGSRL